MRDNRFWALAACIIIPGVMLGVYVLFPLWAADWMSDFGKRRGAVMLIFSASGILMTLMSPVTGRLLTRVPAWQLIVIGSILLGGGFILASRIKTYDTFAAVYIVAAGIGVGLGGVLPCQALAVRLFPQKVGMIGGLMIVALSVSGFAFPLILNPLKSALGWRAAFAITGIGVLAIVPILAFCFMRERAPPRTLEADAVTAPRLLTMGEIFATRSFWIILAGIFPLMLIPTAVHANILSILADHGGSKHMAGYVLSILAVGSGLGAAGFGWLADRRDPRDIILIAAVLMSVALFMMVTGGLSIATISVVMLGLASGGILPILSIFAMREFGTGYAPAMGLLNLFMLPHIFGPPLFGYVRDHTGSYSVALLAGTPILMLGAIGMRRLKIPKVPVRGSPFV